MNTQKTLYLIDAYALIYRSYYAFIKNPRMNSKGENTSAIFGFVNTLEDLLKREKPTHIAVGFDPSGPTFRHEAYELYKAQREKTPEVISWSVPHIKSILEAYRIPVLEVQGFEADDVIGTIAWKAREEGFTVYMMTPDKDYGQLVREGVYMYKPRYGSNEFDVLGPDEITSKYALNNPLQMIDYLALVGDSSDNIPGCPGIGEVTAKKLLAQFGSVDGLLQNTDQLKGANKEKVENNREGILFSKFLATIRTDVPIDFDEVSLRREAADSDQLRMLFEKLEFRNLLNRVMNNQPDGSSFHPTEISKVVEKNSSTVEKNSTVEKKKKSTSLDANGQFSLWDEIIEAKPISVNDLSSNESFSVGNISDRDAYAENNAYADAENEKYATSTSDEENHRILRSLKDTPHSYHLIDSEDEMRHFLTEIQHQESFCFDTETTGLDALTAELVGMSFCWKKNEAYYLPFDADREKNIEKVDAVKKIMNTDRVLKIGQNLKYDLLVLKGVGIEVAGPLFDTMIAHYLIQPELKHGMDFLAEVYLNYRTIPITDLIGPKGKSQKNMRDLPPSVVAPYAAEDADITFQLKEILEAEIEKRGLHTLCYDVEMPLTRVLAEIESTGVYIDRAALRDSSIKMTAQLAEIESEIQELAGFSFNVNSPRQIGEVLFEKLNIGGKAKKTKTGQYSTSEDVLETLRPKHPIVGKILDQRSLKKLLSTYIDALPALVNPRTDRIHTSFNQAVTATGRLSSSNPNLQNIPVRDEVGRDIRKAFAVQPGEWFFSADYSQIELRLMAHLSQDPAMMEAFRNDEDIHAATAAKIFKVPLSDVTSDMRRKAKTANFGIIYGISVFGLAERMGVSRTEAKELIDGYFETFPRVKEYMDEAIRNARENGYVETLLHRKRFLPDIVSQNAVVRGYAERNAINAPIQGTAADIIKVAMVHIQDALTRQNLKTRMILQVHDELNFVVPEDEKEQVQKMVINEMEHAVELSVPLRADTGFGRNWLEAH